MRFPILMILFVFLIPSCDTPPECRTFCNKFGAWHSACAGITNKERACSEHYLEVTDEAQARRAQECWEKLSRWIAETGSGQLNCKIPPPEYIDVEKSD